MHVLVNVIEAKKKKISPAKNLKVLTQKLSHNKATYVGIISVKFKMLVPRRLAQLNPKNMLTKTKIFANSATFRNILQTLATIHAIFSLYN